MSLAHSWLCPWRLCRADWWCAPPGSVSRSWISGEAVTAGQPGYVEASRGWLAGGWWRLTGAGVVRGRERPEAAWCRWYVGHQPGSQRPAEAGPAEGWAASSRGMEDVMYSDRGWRPHRGWDTEITVKSKQEETSGVCSFTKLYKVSTVEL